MSGRDILWNDGAQRQVMTTQTQQPAAGVPTRTKQLTPPGPCTELYARIQFLWDGRTPSRPEQPLGRSSRFGSRIRSRFSSGGMFVLVFVLLLFTSGCPATGLKEGVFVKGELRYTVGSLSGGWREIKVTENDQAYFHRDYGAVIQANATCRADYEDASLATLTSHLFSGLTDRKVIVSQQRTVDKRAALYTELSARLDGVSIQIAILLLKKNECVFDFAYFTRPHNYGRGIGDFHRFIYGFRVLP